MATKATICKAMINIANMDTHYYAEHNLTLAQHPSENDLRLMARIVAFVLNANDDLVFTKGISQDDEPDLWQKSMGGDIQKFASRSINLQCNIDDAELSIICKDDTVLVKERVLYSTN